MERAGEVLDLIVREGAAWYGTERVTQLQHALQAARLAEREGASPALVAAALLHDIGHLMAKDRPAAVDPAADSNVGARGSTRAAPGERRQHDDRHEHIAGGLLVRLFGTAVAEPVRLHVDAKRFLCATEPGYHGTLSPASVRSLELQGGAFSPDAAARFRAGPFAADAVRLRRWDDLAKDPSVETRPLSAYVPLLRSLMR
ncbi:MAG: HD domain-containing protein [Alphaproteobacteria bacterium]|nr:HD domain-containing protein [Alphaproteobacteria bacterium]